MNTRNLTLYYVQSSYGCGLYAALNLQQAIANARAELGTMHYESCTKATEEQIAWVRAMGGRVPSMSLANNDH